MTAMYCKCPKILFRNSNSKLDFKVSNLGLYNSGIKAHQYIETDYSTIYIRERLAEHGNFIRISNGSDFRKPDIDWQCRGCDRLPFSNEELHKLVYYYKYSYNFFYDVATYFDKLSKGRFELTFVNEV